jgi:hypothetical protein
MLIGSTPRKMKTRSSTTIWSPIFMPQMEAHVRACSQLSFVETRHAHHRSNESLEQAVGAIDEWSFRRAPSFTAGSKLDLDASAGTIRVDTAGGQIVSVEVLDRPQLATTLQVTGGIESGLAGDNRLDRRDRATSVLR